MVFPLQAIFGAIQGALRENTLPYPDMNARPGPHLVPARGGSNSAFWRAIPVWIAVGLVMVVSVGPVTAHSQEGEGGSPGARHVLQAPPRLTCATAPEVFKLLCDVYRHISDHYVDPVDAASLASAAASGVRDAGLTGITGTPPACPLPTSEFEQVCVEIDKVEDTAAAVWAASEAMVASLDDPRSALWTPAENRAFLDRQNNRQSRLGLSLSLKEGEEPCTEPSATCRPVIIEVYEGSPAETAGLLVGDVVLELDGVSLSSVSCDDLPGKDRFEDGATVNVRIMRGSQMQTVAVEVTTFSVPIASSELVDGTIGYLRIATLGAAAPDPVRAALQRLVDMNIGALVLDLRGNPGGTVRHTLEVAGLFLPGNQLVFTLHYRSGDSSLHSDGGAPAPDPRRIPMVVATNEGTGSGAEVLTGALVDHDRATVVGTRTYGKHTGQSRITVEDTGGDSIGVVRLTSLRWTTPLGRSAQGGFQPDVESELPSCLPPDEVARRAFASSGLSLATERSPDPDPEPDRRGGGGGGGGGGTGGGGGGGGGGNGGGGGADFGFDEPPRSAELFEDVAAGAWYESAVSWMILHDVTRGCAPAMFCPDREVSRQQFVTFLWRAAGRPVPEHLGSAVFSDVEEGVYSDQAIGWAVSRGVTTGCTPGEPGDPGWRFCPTRAVTRGQMAVLLYRHVEAGHVGRPGYGDVDPDRFYAGGVAWLTDFEAVGGCAPGLFCPDRPATRAEAAVFINGVAIRPQMWGEGNTSFIPQPG